MKTLLSLLRAPRSLLLWLLLALLPAEGAGLFFSQNGLIEAITPPPPVTTPTPLDLSVSCLQYLRNPPEGGIASWTDESGNGKDATQGTSAARPTGVTNVYNGKSCARFDGVNDLLTHSSVTGAAAWLVVKGSAWSSVASYVGGGNNAGWLGDITVGPFTSGPGGFDGTNLRTASTGNRLGTAGLRTVLVTSTKVFIDGTEVSAYKDTGTVGSVVTTQLGTRSDFVQYFAFDLVEYAVFGGTPTSGDLADLQAWAEDEYGAP